MIIMTRFWVWLALVALLLPGATVLAASKNGVQSRAGSKSQVQSRGVSKGRGTPKVRRVKLGTRSKKPSQNSNKKKISWVQERDKRG